MNNKNITFNNSNGENGLFGEPISIYTRKQAIEDGVLVDVTEADRKVLFKVPVALTQAVWDRFVAWTDLDNEKQTLQDQSARLMDVLWVLYLACRKSGDSLVMFKLLCIPRDGCSKQATEIKLKSIIEPGDFGEPVMTIMLPNED